MEDDRSRQVNFQVAELQRRQAFPAISPSQWGQESSGVQLLETHISWILLAGPFAYKIKKPIKTPFLDYRTLDDRLRYCNDELRINRQFAPELYVSVVPIAEVAGELAVDAVVETAGGEELGEAIEYAVKMNRFGSDDLLSDWLERGSVTVQHVEQLASHIAHFHADARVVAPSDWRIQSSILGNAIENLTDLQPSMTGDAAAMLRSLQIWTRDLFEELEQTQQSRFATGYVRECHGDLHAGNIVYWRDGFIPFDGIEFNDSFRCIDVLNDLAFLSMDLLARGNNPLRHALLNAYVEQTADRDALALFRWYEVYRALVRAKVAHLRWQQLAVTEGESSPAPTLALTALDDCHEHIRLAHLLAEQPAPTLTITHGPSGSGKSTAALRFVTHRGAIRLRADVERKRLFGLKPLERPSAQQAEEMYSPEATAKTYARLLSLAEPILAAGYSVVLDATYLKLNQRRGVRELASRMGIEFSILDCNVADDVLRERVQHRSEQGLDASDADLAVLQQQLDNREPLTEDELLCTINV